ncbi:hypothetical protein [Nitrososphaera sp.]|uniref:hypothetical protein n=1 Tax=Nitrososphaera sp. TaxID=1971748 RepID=UPI00307D5360
MPKPLSFLFIGIGAAAIVILGYQLLANQDGNDSGGDDGLNDTNSKNPFKVTGKILMEVGKGRSLPGLALSVNATQSVYLKESVSHIAFWEIFSDWKKDGSAESSLRITDNKGIIDVTDPSQFIVNPAIMGTAEVICPSDKNIRTVEFGSPYIAPLKKGVQGDILIRYNLGMITPDNEKEYRLKFASFYETEVKLPDNAIIKSNNDEICDIDYAGFSKIFLYDTIFELI